MSEKLLIIGAGGHGKEVYEVAQSCQRKVVGFFDTAPPTTTLYNLPVVPTLDQLEYTHVVIAIGSPAIRAHLSAEFASKLCAPLVHPSAVISPSAHIALGAMVMPGAVVSANAKVGTSAIIGQQSYIAHDCVIASHVHVATGCMINGETSVGEGAFVGSGVVTRQGVQIGAGATCGAGAVVLQDVAENTTVVGVPAKPL